MDIRVNGVYSLKWGSSFAAMFNGIYEVQTIFSYAEALVAKVDIKKSVYDACNVSSQFATDLAELRTTNILKLKSVVNDRIVYMPMMLLVEIPNGSVSKFYDLALAVHLGVFKDISELESVRREIEEILLAKLGVTDKPIIYSIKDNWMTDLDYNGTVALRLSNAGGVLSMTNNYTDKRHLVDIVTKLKAKIRYYEEALVKLSGVSEPVIADEPDPIIIDNPPN